MASNTNAALVAAAALAVSAAVYEELKDAPSKTTDDAKTDGAKLDYNVRLAADDKGNKLYYTTLPDAGRVKLAFPPCMRKAVKGADCWRLERDGGHAEPGLDNTMQPGQFTGVECVPTACVIFAGEEPEHGDPTLTVDPAVPGDVGPVDMVP